MATTNERPTAFKRVVTGHDSRAWRSSCPMRRRHGAAYARAVELLGNAGVGELVFLVGGYCLIAILLNAFDVPVPDAEIE